MKKKPCLIKGFVQVYTGDGKGKTTAALGLAVRASGACLNVYIGQFIKDERTSEINALRRIPRITIEHYGPKHFIRQKPSRSDIRAGSDGIYKLRSALNSGLFDLIIADEINNAVLAGIVQLNDVIQLIKDKPPKVELILTGRKAHPRIKQLADLVTEMKSLRHYYAKGITARRGIEF